MIPIDLSGKTAVVTGASQGLGRQTATLLHQAGAFVGIGFLDDSEGHNRHNAQQLADELGNQRVLIHPADVRKSGDVAALLDAVIAASAAANPTASSAGTSGASGGGLDILVNNAAVLRDRTVRKMSDGEWEQVIQTNLTGVFFACRAAASRLRDGGRIVNMASISAAAGFFGQSNYAAAKAGVVAMTKVLSKELARQNITVNAVAPGVVLTEMGQSIPESVRLQMLTQIPLNRFADPKDIGHAILFLCSDLAGYITGQTLHVNGGWYV